MSTFQDMIRSAADKLADAFENFKATKEARKKLEKQLKSKLEEDPEYLQIIQTEKDLKKKRRELSEDIADLKHQKELMMRNLDDYEDLESFVEKTEGAYLTRKDEVLGGLSRDLINEGIEAELNFKNGDLILVVSRKK